MNKHYLLAFLATLPFLLLSQSSIISGQVTNEAGRPLTGATILIKGSYRGTATDGDGRFQLQVNPPDSVLLIRYLGYQSREVSIDERETFDITLRESIRRLDEVVVWGFGSERRRDLTGSVASIDGSELRNVPVPAFQGALPGRLTGVDFNSASGGLNAEPVIRIRGVGSISAGNQPLFVIDGLVLSDNTMSDSYGYRTNPLLNLNPNDIASIEVLKDASTTALYGARGANGVILITTKSGAYGEKARVNLSYYAGFSQASNRYDLLNGAEYARLYNEALLNVNPNANQLFTVDDQPDTDWQDLLLRTGFVQETTAGVSGGSANTKYYFGGTYRDEEGYIITTRLQRYSFRANIEHRIGDRWTAGLSLSPSRVVDRRVGNQWAGSAYAWSNWYAPNVDPYDADGQIIRGPLFNELGFTPAFRGHPVVTAEDQSVRTTTNQGLFRSYLAYQPLEWLTLKTELSAQLHQLENESRFGAATFFGGPQGSGSVLNQEVFAYTWNNLATLRQSWEERHDLELTVGAQFTRENYGGTFLGVAGFPNDDFSTLGSGSRVDGWFAWNEENAFAGYLGRAAYTYRERYLLTLSARYDGSSRFGAGNRYGFFPAVAGAWIVSEEPFFQAGWMDFLKLRASIGLTGNAEIGNYAARGLVGGGYNYDDQPGTQILSLENPDLGWEKSRQWDGAVEFSLGNGRLQGSLGYYLRDTEDLLLDAPVPATNGIEVISENVGAVRNQGFEFELNARLLRGPVRWTLGVNGATLRNEVRRLADRDGDGRDEDLLQNGRILFRPGESIGSFFLVEYAGVDPDNGDALFLDENGAPTSDYSPGARRIVGNSLPGFFGGIANTLTYRNLELSFFFQFETGQQLYLEHHLSLENNMRWGNNQLTTQLDAWRPDHTNTDVPEARLFAQNGNQQSTRYLADADFLRLKTLTLTYTFPRREKRDFDLKLFAAAQNLLTVTGFPGLDPDSEFYPAASAAQGAVRYNLPAARTITFGMNLSF